MESKFINEANRNGSNYGVYYFLGVLVSFLGGQLVGSIPLLAVVFSSGNINLSNINDLTNPAALGISNNLSFFLLVLPFLFSAIFLAVFVKYVHKRPFLTVITPFKKFDFKRFFFAFFIWILLIGSVEIFNYFSDTSNYVLQFEAMRFFLLLLISIPMLLVQTGYEELLFRGYGMQWIGRYIPYRIFPILITSIVFGAMHLANPEVGEFGMRLMVDYVAIGFVMGLVTILSDSLELAMGLHFANNLFLSLFVTFDSSVLQTDAIFRIKTLEISTSSQIFSLILLLLFFIIVKMKYQLKPMSFLFIKDDWKVIKE